MCSIHKNKTVKYLPSTKAGACATVVKDKGNNSALVRGFLKHTRQKCKTQSIDLPLKDVNENVLSILYNQ